MSRITTACIMWGVLGAVAGIVRMPGHATTANAADNTRKPKFTVGKDTTYVTGPLDNRGYIDYAAALNERLRQGVTPENNANVWLWKAFGPRPEGAVMPAEFFKWLGAPAPPRRGAYHVDLFRYLKEQLKVDVNANSESLFDQWDRAALRPWTPVAYPHFVTWLEFNDKPLSLVVEGTKRPHYYSPLVPQNAGDGPAGLLTVLLPGVQRSRDFAHALVTRAMLRVGQGRFDDAWQDLLACHRLGRLIARGGTLIEELVGLAIDNIASEADVAFLDSARLGARGVKDCLRDLQNLPAMPTAADKVDLAERFMMLEIVLMLDRKGIDYLQNITNVPLPLANDPAVKKYLTDIDFDPALRTVNHWCDRQVAALRLKDRAQREKQLLQVEKDVKALQADMQNIAEVVKAFSGEKSNAQTRGQMLGNAVVVLLMPAVTKVHNARDRNEQIYSNSLVAFALVQHQWEHGHYPKTLAALAPRYLDEVPPDLFAGQALTYRPSEKGFLLYSFGVNGLDDGGQTYGDDPPGDDLRVRLPLPKLPAKL
jgi:hypothetical protein